MSDNYREDRVKQQIDANLRRVFESHAQEELPERFKLLLDKLRDSTPDQEGSDKS